MPHVPLQTMTLVEYVILEGILVGKYTNLPWIQYV